MRLKLFLDPPGANAIEYVENCEPTDEEDLIRNIGYGFVISRARLDDPKYFPSFDLPKPSKEEIDAYMSSRGVAPGDRVILDLTEALGGLRHAAVHWHLLRTAHGFSVTGQHDLMQRKLCEFYMDEILDDDLSIEGAIIRFIVRFLSPLAVKTLPTLLQEAARARKSNGDEFSRLVKEFRPLGAERLREYVDVIDLFMRAYDELNQTLIYVRRSLALPVDPYAPSVDFESTRMYYGEAFEALGSHLDFIAALNNVAQGRAYDQLNMITLAQYRDSDKGRRAETVRTNPQFAALVGEYDNKLRNASHHRWLRLSPDRSEMRYRDGNVGDVQTISYAEYLYRCCSITSQLMLVACLELMILHDI